MIRKKKGNWPRFVKLTLIKKISALFMEIFDPERRANFDFCKLKLYLSKN